MDPEQWVVINFKFLQVRVPVNRPYLSDPIATETQVFQFNQLLGSALDTAVFDQISPQTQMCQFFASGQVLDLTDFALVQRKHTQLWHREAFEASYRVPCQVKLLQHFELI